MRIFNGRSVAVIAVAMMVLGLSGSSWAKTLRKRVHRGRHTQAQLTKGQAKLITGEAVVAGVMPAELTAEAESSPSVADLSSVAGASSVPSAAAVSGVPQDGKQYRLRMANMHTGETLDLVYRVGNVYIPAALEKLNAFLRDHYTQDVVDYDPKEFDVLHAMMARLRRPNGLIDVVCGYRTPETNAALRQNSPRTGVAEHSQHMEGHAIDLRVPGASTVQVRNAALSLHAGGVGYYPVSQFVHVDVGPVREWAFGARPRRVVRRRRGASVNTGM